MTTTLIIPGLHSSGPAHWQSWFEERIPGTIRVIQPDWSKPDLATWAQRIRRDISRTPGRIAIAAHSFGALAAVQAASDFSDRIAGALLVAPADPEKFGIADLLPQTPLDFKAAVVASTNDPWLSIERAASWADIWNADLVNLGPAGHINVDSGFGPWPEGLALLERLLRGADQTRQTSVANRARRSLRRRTAAALSRTAAREEWTALHHAASLLRAHGWHVAPPSAVVPVIRAVHQ